jgi:hypothetical protein
MKNNSFASLQRSYIGGHPDLHNLEFWILDFGLNQYNSIENLKSAIQNRITVAGQRRICTGLSPLRLMAAPHQNR